MYKRLRYGVLGALFLICGGIWVWYTKGHDGMGVCKTHHDTYKVISHKLQATNYKLLLADTPDKIEYGLMNIRSKADICGHDGMLFVFPRLLIQTFWNQHTLVPLTLYWMRGNTVIGTNDMTAIDPVRGPQTWESPAPVDQVVEVLK